MISPTTADYSAHPLTPAPTGLPLIVGLVDANDASVPFEATVVSGICSQTDPKCKQYVLIIDSRTYAKVNK